MNILDQFDVSKFTLGDICGNGHEYQQSGKSLRRLKGGKCPECDKQKYLDSKQNPDFQLKCELANEKKRKKYAENPAFAQLYKDQSKAYQQLQKNARKAKAKREKADPWRRLFPEKHEALSNIDISQNGFHLGKLCVRGHEYRDSSLSLRNQFGCVQCYRDKMKDRECYICKKQFNMQGMPRVYDGEYRYICSECVKCIPKKYCHTCKIEKPIKNFSLYKRCRDGRHSTCKDCVQTLGQFYRHANPEKCKSRSNARKKRVFMYSDGTVTKQYIAQALTKAKKCIYCDTVLDKDNKSVDHIIPLSLGGAHSAGNIVICCLPCNISKGGRSFLEWTERLGQKQKNKAISLYRKRYGSEPSQLTLSLAYNEEPDFDYVCSICQSQIIGELPVKKPISGKGDGYVCTSCSAVLKAKVCIKCRIEKPMEDFLLDKRSRDKRTGYCKECNRSRKQALR